MVDVIGFSGSPRPGGNTDILLDNFLKGAKIAGARTEKICLRDYVIQPCVGCEQCRKHKTCTKLLDGMQSLYPRIEAARGLILGSPTYNYNVTSGVKSFIDRLYPYYIFDDSRPRDYSSRFSGQGRKAIVFTVCEQEDIHETGFALQAMKMPLEALGYDVIEEFLAKGCFDRAVVRTQKELLETAVQHGIKLVQDL